MPSTHKTPFLNLNRWLGSDKPKREDFCGDNEKIDAAVKAHTDDMGTHVSAAERAAWQGSIFAVGSYTGDFTETRTISLGYKPRAVIVFTASRPLVEYKKAPDTCNIYSAVYTAAGATQGISAAAAGFTVECGQTSVMGGNTNALNQMGKTYIYIAWR